MSLRHYLFPEQEPPLRLSQRLVEGLVAGTDAMPQYAGTRQKILTARLQLDEGKPLEILDTSGSTWTFDGTGGIREGLHSSFAEVMSSLGVSESSNQTVVDLRPRISKKKIDTEHRWQPSTADIERVIKDIWPKTKADRLHQAAGVSKRRPPLTYDAKHALDEIAGGFWKIENSIDNLKEPSLKGFIFEARTRSSDDPEYGLLYQAVAEMAQERFEILRAQRSDKGVWYALVEVTLWQDHIGECVERVFEKCSGKGAAITTARRLLAANANKFSENVTVEAELLTELEWIRRSKLFDA
ncbi:hypothetical protein [Pararhizobium sp. DWP3-4]|uniref:hypothetical protein n=1 Tax=Pararhizobium sp. DWP3-4 TaxID=2804565 RepID=UPI003CF49636